MKAEDSPTQLSSSSSDGVASGDGGAKRSSRRRAAANPADAALRGTRLEAIRFPDLTERCALKLGAVPTYVATLHFGLWQKRFGAPSFQALTGVFTPLVLVDLSVSDVPLDMRGRVRIRGESVLGRVLHADASIRHLVRDGSYVVETEDGVEVARARMVNVFTRYDTDPAKRRVTELPPSFQLGATPSRIVSLPEVEELVPARHSAPLEQDPGSAWHYSQTDPNRHVNGMAYFRTVEDFVMRALHGHGHDLKRLFPQRVRLFYRKPCFRGEGFVRVPWLVGEAPLVVATEVRKQDDGPGTRAAVAVELTFGQHAAE